MSDDDGGVASASLVSSLLVWLDTLTLSFVQYESDVVVVVVVVVVA